jgi:hypothetical protein
MSPSGSPVYFYEFENLEELEIYVLSGASKNEQEEIRYLEGFLLGNQQSWQTPLKLKCESKLGQSSARFNRTAKCLSIHNSDADEFENLCGKFFNHVMT